MIPDNFSPDKIRLINIQTMGRASSYFFQGLFDGHPDIVTFPIHSYTLDEELQGSNTLVAKKAFRRVNSLFGTPTKKFVKWSVFKNFFLEYVDKYGLSKKTFFVGLHYSVARSMKNEIGKVKYIAFQGHTFPDSKDIIKDFPKQKFIFLARDPRGTYFSQRFKNHYGGIPFMTSVVHFQFLYYMLQKKQFKSIAVRHEDLHKNYPLVRKRLCKFLNIKPSKILNHSSFYGSPFTGKSLWVRSSTGVYSAEPNPIYVHDRWKKKLLPSELKFCNVFCKQYIQHFRYPIWTTSEPEGKYFYVDGSEYVKEILWPDRKLPSLILSIPLLGPLLFRLLILGWYVTKYTKELFLYLRMRFLINSFRRP